MKKSSTKVNLFLIGTMSLLVSCTDPIETSSFDSVKQCINSGAYSVETCRSSFADAKTDHSKNSPQFSKKELCEEEFGVGNCETSSSSGGSSSFAPMMMGYLMGNMMNNNSSSGVYPQALYQNRSGNIINSRGVEFSNKFGQKFSFRPTTSTSGTSAKALPTRAPMVTSSGGFGRSISVGG